MAENFVYQVMVPMLLFYLWRRERDLNPRVHRTMDFESIAIPGYAISAVIFPHTDWS